MTTYEKQPSGNEIPMVLTKTITSSAKKPLFFTVSLEPVHDPLGDNKKNLPPLTLKEMANSVTVYPQKLMIRPGRSAQIRITMPKGHNNADLAFYYLSFNPVVPNKEMGFDINDNELDTLRMGSQMLIGLSSALVIEPSQANYQYKASQQGDQLTINNTGNALLTLETLGDLSNTEEKKFSVSTKNIYPGQSYVLDQGNYIGSVRAAIITGAARETLSL